MEKERRMYLHLQVQSTDKIITRERTKDERLLLFYDMVNQSQDVGFMKKNLFTFNHFPLSDNDQIYFYTMFKTIPAIANQEHFIYIDKTTVIIH